MEVPGSRWYRPSPDDHPASRTDGYLGRCLLSFPGTPATLDGPLRFYGLPVEPKGHDLALGRLGMCSLSRYRPVPSRGTRSALTWAFARRRRSAALQISAAIS